MNDRPSDEPHAEPVRLFVYGTLKPRNEVDAARQGFEADAVRGTLYDLGPFPGLFDCGDPSAGWVEGFVRPVDADELTQRLDPYEGVDEGMFARVRTTTREGLLAWVYVFARPLPKEAVGPLDSWTPSRP